MSVLSPPADSPPVESLPVESPSVESLPVASVFVLFVVWLLTVVGTTAGTVGSGIFLCYKLFITLPIST